MPSYKITGGKPLSGEIQLSGAKNSASKMMIASLLTDEPVVLLNVPRQQETKITSEICEAAGAKITWTEQMMRLETPAITRLDTLELSARNRIGVLAIAPLLHRTGEAFVPMVGGDKIGPRPVNWHLEVLRKMGAQIDETEEGFRASVKEKLNGALIELPYPSVGATETTVLAGVLAKGRTVIENAAVEPEIFELIKMLQKMGAIVEVGAGRHIEIIGVEKLSGCHTRVIPDALEAASYACMALGTHGEIFVKEAVHDHMITFLNAVRRIGGKYDVGPDGILFSAVDGFRGIEIETDTYPGFRTDWQQPFTVLLTQAAATSVVHETVYESRFGYTEALNRMGADITLSTNCLGEVPCRFKGQNYKHSAVIKGPTNLHSSEIEIPDIRAGLAFVVAALVATGTSTLTGIEHLDRGYVSLEEKMRNIGADITRVS
ncbi:MAG: hypothetical protein ACD_76C00122G0006 [uncultured bacterium]|nr:MAG: hypothetical protein ACD_76C00122G0006 [uncultured bacterium]HBD05319.1 UDP-N-acetylglucosamine 1-carboxyvinyltransferase [Candidatus Uhrbacteria bacterium]